MGEGHASRFASVFADDDFEGCPEQNVLPEETLKLDVRTLNVESRKESASFLDSTFSVLTSNF
jgi:hypothetical protein